MTYRFATPNDADLLGGLNHQLIQDEGHRNPMSSAQLADRMHNWLLAEYRAILFSCRDHDATESVDAYVLYRESSDSLYLRQFFVQRYLRRKGIGRQCMQLLLQNIWPRDKRITVDVLSHNVAAVAFWHSLNFSDYCLTLELLLRSRES